MKYVCPLIVVQDMDASVDFYRRVLGLEVITDFGANKTLTGGFSLQTADTYREFIDGRGLAYGSNTFELYFEADDFDAFAEKLQTIPIEYVHPVREHAWGQRVVRFYDPDRHIIEVGENIQAVCRRFMSGGMSAEQTAVRMDVPVDFVKAALSGPSEVLP